MKNTEVKQPTPKEKITSFAALYRGLKRSCRGVRWKDSVVGYEWNGLKNTYRLRHELLDGTYKLRPHQVFYVTEPKVRKIMAVSIRDRQFQHALVDEYLYETLSDAFIRDNYACQKDRGISDCLKRLKAQTVDYTRKYGNAGWVLKCDVKKFFDSIPHEVAKEVVSRMVSDEWVVSQVNMIIDSYPGDSGLGLGSQISQLLGLAVLNEMDHKILDLHPPIYGRYQDDFVIVHPQKEYLEKCLDVIRSAMDDLGLSLNQKTQIYPLKQGIKILHWRIVIGAGHEWSGGITYPVRLLCDQSKGTKQIQKCKKLLQMGKVEEAEASMRSHIAYLKLGDTYNYRTVLSHKYRQIGGKFYGAFKKPGSKYGKSGHR